MTLIGHEIAGGSVSGRAHVLAGRNNQDAAYWRVAGPVAAAVVCDGCSGGPRSEAGAILGARLVCETALRRAGDARFAERLRDDVVSELRRIAEAAGSGSVADCLLFTVVGAIVAPAGACVFSIGDGVVAWNGGVRRIGPYPDNEPPYLAYGLQDPDLRFTVHHAGEAESILVGTDGVADFGPLEEFWIDERYFQNPDRVRRRLKLARLPDDSALVVIRRRP